MTDPTLSRLETLGTCLAGLPGSDKAARVRSDVVLNEPAHPIPSGHPEVGGAPGRLQAALDHASHLLPAQGPISVFIHHNTLHAFEEFPFREATEKAAGVFGCEPYPTEARFHIERGKGRILDDDLRAALADQGLWDDRDAKPGDPKAAMDWALRSVRRPPSSAIFRSAITETIS